MLKKAIKPNACTDGRFPATNSISPNLTRSPRENVSRCTTGVGKIIELQFSILIYNFGCIRHNTLTCVEFESNLTFSGHHLIPKVVIIIVYFVALKTENGKVDFSGENAITRSGGPAHVLMHL